VGASRQKTGSERVLPTRRELVQGWEATADNLERKGRRDLANLVWGFIEWMPSLMTERQWIAEQLPGRMAQNRAKDRAPLR
jgi:hypothetical protein